MSLSYYEGCSFSSTDWSVQFIKFDEYSRKITLFTSTLGVLGVLVAVFLVNSLDTYILKWIVILVLLYSAYTMLSSQLKKLQQLIKERFKRYFLKKEDIIKSFSMREAIDADKKALSLYSAGKASVPLRTNIDVPKSNGQSLYMPAYVEGGEGALGVKIVSVYPENIKKNLPSVPATMIVLDPETGMVSACLDGTYLTQLRTGAVQGAATELLAKEDAKIGALIGTGGQAQSQLEAMLTVRKLEEVRIFDIDFERASQFAEEMMQQFSVTMRPTKTNQECVEGADIITSVTTSKRATFSAEWVKKGAHINGVGAYTPEMCEIPREIIKAADIVIFDTMDGVLKEAGDFISPLQDGYIQRDSYHGELGQLINEELVGRTSGEQITIFKTVGSAVLDVVVATEIVKKAKENNLGKLIY